MIKRNEGMHEASAAYILSRLGASVETIPPDSSSKRPDFLAIVGTERVAIEVKDKFPDPRIAIDRARSLSSSRVHAVSLPTGRQTAIASTLKKASKQLAGNAHGSPAFRLIWVNAVGDYPSAIEEQVIATAFGAQRILCLERDTLARCFYFHESSFFSHRHILNGAVVARIEGQNATVRLLLNSCSERYQSLASSNFRHPFGTAIIDPLQEEAAGNFILARYADRTNESTKLAYIQDRYQCGPVQTFSMEYIEHTVAFPAGAGSALDTVK